MASASQSSGEGRKCTASEVASPRKKIVNLGDHHRRPLKADVESTVGVRGLTGLDDYSTAHKTQMDGPVAVQRPYASALERSGFQDTFNSLTTSLPGSS